MLVSPPVSSRWFKGAILGVALLALPLSLGGCDRQGSEAAQPAKDAAATGAEGAAPGAGTPLNGRLDIASRGARMPEFALKDPAGKVLRSSDLIGKPVLINLWATWCGPCVIEMPMLDSLAGEDGAKLRVVTVSQDITGAEKVAPFFAKNPYKNLEPWLDPENQLSIHYGTGILPTTILYDKDGREVWRMIGGHDWSGPRTAAMIGETLGS